MANDSKDPIDSSNSIPAEQVSKIPPSATAVSAPKKRSKNALTHGIYAEEIVLPWEDPKDLMKLRDDIWKTTQPEDRLQEETALGVVRLMWLKRRLMRTSQLVYYRDPQCATSEAKDWDGLLASMTSAAIEKGNLSGETKEALEKLKQATEKLGDLNKTLVPGHNQPGPPKEAFDAAQEALRDAKFCSKILTEQVFPRLCKLEEVDKSQPITVYETAYSADDLDKTMRLEAALDARIDKQLGRLVNLKEFNRLKRERMKEVPNAPSKSLTDDTIEPKAVN